MSSSTDRGRAAPVHAGQVAFAVINALACGLLGFTGAVTARLAVVALLGYLFAVGCVALGVALVALPQQRRRLTRWSVVAFLPAGVLIFLGVLTPPDSPGPRGCAPGDPRPLCRPSAPS